MARRTLPFQVEVLSPCTESWETMTGTARRRHCESCKKQVYDFSTMTTSEIEQLVLESNGHLCVRLTHRKDGSLVHREAIAAPSRVAAFTLSAGLALSPLAYAQSSVQSVTASQPILPNTYTAVSGIVTDSQGALVVGSSVTLLLNGVALGSTQTNEVGRFEFAVAPGDYELRIAAHGFAPSSRSLSVAGDNAEVGNIPLTPPPTQTTVTISTQSLTNSTTMGVMVSSYGPWYKRLAYHLRHPVASAKHLFHHY